MQVIWRMSTGERSFLPRLGAAISAIVACRHDAAKFVVCQADNTIRLVSLLRGGAAVAQPPCASRGLRHSNHMPIFSAMALQR